MWQFVAEKAEKTGVSIQNSRDSLDPCVSVAIHDGLDRRSRFELINHRLGDLKRLRTNSVPADFNIFVASLRALEFGLNDFRAEGC